MNTVFLIVFVLNVQSSYADNVEREATGSSRDTVQFMLASGHAWRIKTFAIDHDVHVWHIGEHMQPEALETLARKNTSDHYGDVIERIVVVPGDGTLASLQPRLAAAGLAPNLDIAPGDEFAFWTPDAGPYRTRTQPR